MFRFVATKLGGAAVVTAGAAATVGTTSESSARIRPAQFPRSGGSSAPGGVVGDTISDDWLPFSVEGEDVVFGRDEVKEGIQDILSLANGGKVDLITDSDSVESFGADADEIIASSSSSTLAFGQGAGLQTLANFTEKLLARPSIQKEFLDAIHNDQEMKDMFGELAGQEGAELQIFQRPPHRSITHGEIEDITGVPEGRGSGRLDFLDKFVRDIGRGLESAGDFLGKVGRWVRTRVAKDNAKKEDDDFVPDEVELGHGEKVAGAILFLAAAVMVVVVAKRLGLLRVFR